MDLPLPRGVQTEEVITCSQVSESIEPGIGRYMSFKQRCIKVIAWLNFGLAFAGVIKFFPIAYLLVVSHWGPVNQSAYEWSLDLISDTHLIILVWGCVLAINKALSGHLIVRPWRPLNT